MSFDEKDFLLAVRDINQTLESLVVGPLATSVPALRARYQLDLLKQMLKEGHQWRYYRTRIDEFDKKHKL